MNVIEVLEEHGLRIEIIPDDDPTNPRKEFDQVGVIAHWHRRYDLGDREATETEREALSRGGFALLERYLRRTEGATVVIPLGLLDHSGLHIWAGGGPHWSDSAGWDSGTVGFIYAPAERVKKMGVAAEDVEKQLRAEVEEHDQYLRGDVYGFIVREPLGEDGDADTEELDSCWGFFGLDFCKAAAIESAKAVAEARRKMA